MVPRVSNILKAAVTEMVCQITANDTLLEP
jgi:hypothetical protein